MFETILAPVDGSDPSRRGLTHAMSLGEEVDATVHVLTVVEPSRSSLTFGIDEVEDINRATTDLVETLEDSNDWTDVSIQIDVRRGDPVYEVILDYANETGVDLVVLGRQGELSLSDAVVGSTADRVARFSDIPVTLVPGPRTE
jgi:nucleotide-binding universal stress UspA family protein